MKSERIVFLSLLLGLVMSGCSQKLPEGMPKLYPCTVTFVQGAEPLQDATIDLLLQEGDTKWNISATTDEEGRAVFMTHGRYKGAPEGKYKVVITKRETGGKTAKGFTRVYSLIDKKYTNPATTTLEVEVKEKMDDDTKIDLGAPVKKYEVDRLEPPSKAKG